ncbi:hypothetical protein ZWY2020_060106 [Hordeum vulgare]|nr:hypothetical protein ZWY2020_060106 [Hordeum vulgare]
MKHTMRMLPNTLTHGHHEAEVPNHLQLPKPQNQETHAPVRRFQPRRFLSCIPPSAPQPVTYGGHREEGIGHCCTTTRARTAHSPALAAHLYFSAAGPPVRFFPQHRLRPHQRKRGLPFDEIEDVYLLDFVVGPPGFVADIARRFRGLTSRIMESSSSATEVKYLPENKLEEMVHKLFKFAFSSGLKDLDIEFNVNANGKLFDQKQTLIDDCLEKSFEIALGCGQFGNSFIVFCFHYHQQCPGSVLLRLSTHDAISMLRIPELNNDEMLKIGLRSLEQENTFYLSGIWGGGHGINSFLLSVAEFERWKVGAEPSTA